MWSIRYRYFFYPCLQHAWRTRILLPIGMARHFHHATPTTTRYTRRTVVVRPTLPAVDCAFHRRDCYSHAATEHTACQRSSQPTATTHTYHTATHHLLHPPAFPHLPAYAYPPRPCLPTTLPFPPRLPPTTANSLVVWVFYCPAHARTTARVCA